MKQLAGGLNSYSKQIRNGFASLSIASLLFTAGSVLVYAQTAPKVAVSIAPIHSIAAFIMGGVGSPELIVPASASPHDFSLKPSQAELLEKSDLVIWVGHDLETFLEKPLETIASRAEIIELLDLAGMKILEARTDEAFESGHEGHDHGDDHKDDDLSDHSQKHKEEDGHDDHAHEEEKHDEHAHANHGGKDPHIWLSTENAGIAANAITVQLVKLDPENSAKYQQNLTAFTNELDQLNADIRAGLESVGDKPFLVYHDAYHYFEDDFGLNASGVFSLNPEIKPGARKLKELSETLKDRNIVCIFSEPQFSTKSMDLLIAEHPELTINKGVLDPLGSDFETGPKHYFQTITAMKDAFMSCLK